MTYDVIVRDGLWFDGTGKPAQVRNLGIRDGTVVTVSAGTLDETGCAEVIDAAGKSAEQHDGRALVIILDHITDAGNLGAVSRSAEAVAARSAAWTGRAEMNVAAVAASKAIRMLGGCATRGVLSRARSARRALAAGKVCY